MDCQSTRGNAIRNGGYPFVLSGFSAAGNTMQTGGAPMGAYALCFITPYYTK